MWPCAGLERVKGFAKSCHVAGGMEEKECQHYWSTIQEHIQKGFLGNRISLSLTFFLFLFSCICGHQSILFSGGAWMFWMFFLGSFSSEYKKNRPFIVWPFSVRQKTKESFSTKLKTDKLSLFLSSCFLLGQGDEMF